MKKLLKFFWLLPVFLFLHFENTNAQCYCGSNEITPVPSGFELRPYYNELNQIYKYTYTFGFPCIDMASDPTSMNDESYYGVLYRRAGTNDPWTEVECTVWDDYQDFLLDVPNLLPGVAYEFTVTCPCEDLFCNYYEQIQNFYNGNPETNVMPIWEFRYCPGFWVENMDVANIGNAGTEATIFWHTVAIPPGESSISYRPVTTPASNWIEAGTTNNSSFNLTGLSPCTEYQAKVTLSTDCGFDSKTINFKTSDCSVNIQNIKNVTGVSADITWSYNSPIPPNSYTLSWWEVGSSNIYAISSYGNHYRITGLAPETEYNVQVTPNCSGSSQCSANSQIWKFETLCDPYDNSTFETAAPIPYNVTINAGGSNIHDDDFYSFVPECERIKVIIDKDGIPIEVGMYEEYTTDLPYEIYDENFNLVPKRSFVVEPISGEFSKSYHAVNPGHTHYIRVLKPNYLDLTRLRKCYNLTIIPCNDCYENQSNLINGWDITGVPLPAQATYTLEIPFYYSDLTWEIVSGDAFIYQSDLTQASLSFDEAGTVELAAHVTRCDGAEMTYYKTIKVVPLSGCEITGTVVTNTQEGNPLEGYNNPDDSNYFVFLDIPPGTNFSWVLLEGEATFQVESVGTLSFVEVFQTSEFVVFGLLVDIDGCLSTYLTYVFEAGDHLVGDEEEAFRIQPNPVVDVLTVEALPANNNLQELQNNGIRLEVLNANMVKLVAKDAGPSDAWNINCAGLVPGNYFLRIIHSNQATVLPFFKI